MHHAGLPVSQLHLEDELIEQSKVFEISKDLVWKAYLEVKSNRGSAGIDGISLLDFEKNLKKNLYKIWNRLSSGSYFPSPVKRVEIPKAAGGKRVLGVPTVSDRIAQTVVKMCLEPLWDKLFHENSYGYRPNKSALDAVAITRKRCWRYSWVVEFDIKGAFDNIDHELLMKAVSKHTDERWMLLYIERWLKAPHQDESGVLRESTLGVPQGGVISPLLMNLFMHYAFDCWMVRSYPKHPFSRYADDAVVHCNSLKVAEGLLQSIAMRLTECKLAIHPKKSKVVCCQPRLKSGKGQSGNFTFLGYNFRPRYVVNKEGVGFTSFQPGVSNEASKQMRMKIRGWKLHRITYRTLNDISEEYNSVLRGWWNYYGAFCPSELRKVFVYFHKRLMLWVRRKYRRFKRRRMASFYWLRRVALDNPDLFISWKIFGVTEAA